MDEGWEEVADLALDWALSNARPGTTPPLGGDADHTDTPARLPQPSAAGETRAEALQRD